MFSGKTKLIGALLGLIVLVGLPITLLLLSSNSEEQSPEADEEELQTQKGNEVGSINQLAEEFVQTFAENKDIRGFLSDDLLDVLISDDEEVLDSDYEVPVSSQVQQHTTQVSEDEETATTNALISQQYEYEGETYNHNIELVALWEVNNNKWFVQEMNPRLISQEGDSITEPDQRNQWFEEVYESVKKFEGHPYVFGGSNPQAGFDTSGLTMWAFQKAGINLPRTAQLQYDAVQKIPNHDAVPGDLVFFENTYTYNAEQPITHVGIYVGDGRMFDSNSSGVGYSDITNGFWNDHFVGFGRPQ